MTKAVILPVKADVTRTVLTDEYAVYKTERFCTEYRELKDADAFVSKLTDALFLSKMTPESDPPSGSYRLQAGPHNLFFSVRSGDPVFFAYRSDDNKIRINDRRLSVYMSVHPEFEIALSESGLKPSEADFTKLYRVAEADGVNYPKLNPRQRAAVEAEDSSVLIQGVAGSGKTNLCIDKILFTASRNYAGKTLYTTYSRGLLTDTAKRVNTIKQNVDALLKAFDEKKVVVIGKDLKRALEYKLGVYLLNDENRVEQLKSVRDYLENKVEFALIPDLYARYAKSGKTTADESFFMKEFASSYNRVGGLFKKLTGIGAEIVYKEIYGYIHGMKRDGALSEDRYVRERACDFTRAEAETIFRIAKEYSVFLKEHNAADNAMMAKELEEKGNVPRYSVVVADEVQDFTETELSFLKSVSLKLFAVGDALQMINPSYFSFAFLKSLVWREGHKSVELKHNYRSTKKIAELTEKLGELNMSRFGTHNFVLRSRIVDSNVETSAVYVHGGAFRELLKKASLDGYTLIVGDRREKERLREALPSSEILTVSEAKGLEREVVILYNVLSGHIDKWSALEKARLNRKTADENSVYRYYFNLFYVGVTRAKSHLTVFESREIPFFKPFFETEFSAESAEGAITRLEKILERVETDDAELKRRVEEFIRLGQYDNAMIAADRIRDDVVRRESLEEVRVYSLFVNKGDYRGAGIAFWEKGMYAKAREMFSLSGNRGLIEFMDACIGKGNSALDYGIVSYFNEVTDPSAGRLITETLNEDLEQMKKTQREVKQKLSSIRRKHG